MLEWLATKGLDRILSRYLLRRVECNSRNNNMYNNNNNDENGFENDNVLNSNNKDEK